MTFPRKVSQPVFGHVEDIMLGILKPFFEGQGIHIVSLFEESMPLPAIVARQDRKSGTVPNYLKDTRFILPALLSIDSFTEGPDADQDGADLQEACRIAIHEAWYQQIVIPGAGYIAQIENAAKPSRVADWATATGPVQFASLPKHVVRYEANYRLLLRPDSTQENMTNPYVTSL